MYDVGIDGKKTKGLKRARMYVLYSTTHASALTVVQKVDEPG